LRHTGPRNAGLAFDKDQRALGESVLGWPWDQPKEAKMSETIRVKSVVTALLHTIRRDARALEANAPMEEHQIRHLPMIDDGQLAGVVSDRDIKLMLSS
jgi:CBS-domain-containing membrane protein